MVATLRKVGLKYFDFFMSIFYLVQNNHGCFGVQVIIAIYAFPSYLSFFTFFKTDNNLSMKRP